MLALAGLRHSPGKIYFKKASLSKGRLEGHLSSKQMRKVTRENQTKPQTAACPLAFPVEYVEDLPPIDWVDSAPAVAHAEDPSIAICRGSLHMDEARGRKLNGV